MRRCPVLRGHIQRMLRDRSMKIVGKVLLSGFGFLKQFNNFSDLDNVRYIFLSPIAGVIVNTVYKTPANFVYAD